MRLQIFVVIIGPVLIIALYREVVVAMAKSFLYRSSLADLTSFAQSLGYDQAMGFGPIEKAFISRLTAALVTASKEMDSFVDICEKFISHS